MSHRRRQKNPLLMRIFVISVIIHAIALPLMAHFGAFKKIGQSLGITHVIVVPPPPKEKAQTQAKKAQKVAQTQKSKTASPKRASGPKSNLNQPRVVAAKSEGGTSESSGPTVDANGSGAAGVVPTPKNEGNGTPTPGPEGNPQPKPEPKPATPDPKLEPKVTDPSPNPAIKEKKPVFTEVAVTFQPIPVIPDDLRVDALSAEAIIDFTVLADGSVGLVKLVRTTGNDTLDQLGLEAARKWRFRPATRDGEAIESQVRLHIQYEVK